MPLVQDDYSEKLGFSPTPEQAEAVDAIIDWFRGDPKFYVLKGYAGTGKTYLMTYLARTGLRDITFVDRLEEPMHSRINPSQICFTAPTNKAVKVLRNYLDGAGLSSCNTETIYSLLGLILLPSGELKEITKGHKDVDLSCYKLIVVDEASMVNSFLMSAIEDAFAEWRVPFLFMGDPAQLPPVGELSAPVWSIPNVSELTTVMRHGGACLDLATSIRKVVDAPFPSIKISTQPPVYRVGKEDWFAAIVDNLDLFRSGEAKCIAWRNETVRQYNGFIRRHIFGDAAHLNLWLPEDKIIAIEPLKDPDGEIFIRTDEEATILNARLGQHPKFPEYEVWEILALDEMERKVTIRALTTKGQHALNNRLAELFAEAKSGKKYLWRKFWQLKEAFNEIRHSYAITSHRSQGSSYRKTFVDLEDIMRNLNRQEAFRSLYVACTRQREEIYIA